MRTYRLEITRGLSSLAVLLLLAACGGGGGGGGGPAPLVYSGNTSPAVITTTNSSTITANALGGADSAQIIGGVSAESSNAAQDLGTGPADLARRLSRAFREPVASKKFLGPNQQAVSGAQIDDTQPCDFGNGTIHIVGPLDDFGTGTVTVTFSNCLLSGVTLNGTGSMRIDVFLTDFTMSFARLTLRGASLNIDAGGSLHFQEFGNTLTITMNLDELNNSTGKMRKSVNLVIVDVYNDINFPTSFTQTLAGQVFHSDHGYVNVTTISPFVFGTLAQLFPDSGQMLLTGDVNRTIRVTALNSTLVQLQLDTNGDGTVDNTARLKWIELTGPVGTDLGDTDGDGMHNSWETFHGAPLNPLVNDAGGDADGDLVTNINEYLAGTDPTL